LSWFGRAGLVLLALALFLPGITLRDLWNPDEPRYAVVAREMRERGDWLVPHLNGRIYSEKPPLHFWSIAAVAAATGEVGPLAARLPSVAAAAVAFFALFGMARRLYDREVAGLAVLIFATGAKVLWQGRIGQIDMTLVALVTVAMACFVRGMVEGRDLWFRLFFAVTGLATLAKGPVGLLPPLLSIVAFALVSGRRDLLRRMRIPTGLLLWAAIVAAWLIPAALAAGGGYLETLLFKQNLTRYADPWHHRQPWYYYLTVIPADFFPWSLFLPGAIWLGWRRSTVEERRGFMLALCWTLVTLVFFSLSPAKRTVYVLTMYPAMALLLAAALAEIRKSAPRLRGWLVTPAAIVALLAMAVPVVGYLAVSYYPERVAKPLAALAPLGPGLLPILLVLALLVSAAALIALLAAVRGSPAGMVQALAAGMGGAAVGIALFVLPRFDVVKSARFLSAELVARAAPGDPWAIYPRLDATFLFHTRRHAEEISGEAALYAFAERPGPVWLLIQRDDLAKLPRALPLVEVARDLDERTGYVLMTHRPAAAAPLTGPPASDPGEPPGEPLEPPRETSQVRPDAHAQAVVGAEAGDLPGPA
jgi:4-amino-4-deoxy-L-arabinose transferase-like glycosyltransferase